MVYYKLRILISFACAAMQCAIGGAAENKTGPPMKTGDKFFVLNKKNAKCPTVVECRLKAIERCASHEAKFVRCYGQYSGLLVVTCECTAPASSEK